jgi:hypothetical protein
MTETVLFVRCVPQPLAQRALRAIRRARPHARIDVLSNGAAGAALAASGDADAVVEYPGASYALLDPGVRVLPRLRRRRYDLVVVPYTSRGREAFWNVARLALLAGGRATVWQHADAAESPAPEWMPVRLCDWWQSQSPGARLRAALLNLLRVPALVVAYGVAMVGLAAAALVLIPAVWLKPASTGGRS